MSGPDEINLSRLMVAAQGGNKEAYAALLYSARRWLKRYLHNKLSSSDIDDVVQDILVAVHNKRASYDASRPFLPWLAAIARYRWVDHLRQHYRHQTTAIDDQVFTADNDEEITMARISLDRMLATLSSSQAEAITLVRIEGHSVSEAARLSGQSEALVKVNIHRGLKKLAAQIEKAD